MKNHCRQGHEFDKRNTHYRPNGNRVCRQCGRDRAAKRRDQCPTR
jgi:hypothetical protein